MSLRAPEHRRGHTCRRRHVRGGRAEEVADEACRRPAHEGDRAARTADPEELRGRLLVVGREHRAEDGGDGIERRVRERQCLGVALDELDLEPLGGGAHAALVEQGRHVVDADGRAAEPGGRDRRVAAAGGDVEDAPAGVQVGGVAELLGDDLDLRRDDGEVAARPGLLLPLLDRLQVWSRCCEVFVMSVPFSLSGSRQDSLDGAVSARWSNASPARRAATLTASIDSASYRNRHVSSAGTKIDRRKRT